MPFCWFCHALALLSYYVPNFKEALGAYCFWVRSFIYSRFSCQQDISMITLKLCELTGTEVKSNFVNVMPLYNFDILSGQAYSWELGVIVFYNHISSCLNP